MRNAPAAVRARQEGFTMMEIMITVIVIAIGLLGLAGLQTKMVGVEMEAYQRSHAMILLDDMMNRIRADEAGARANNYDSTGGSPCTVAAICAWLDGLAGVAGTEEVGAMIGAQGCLESISATPKTIRVSVAWQGMTPTAAPPAELTCGQGNYGDETLRRVVSGTVVILPEEE